MKIEDQACSFEQAETLYKLGVTCDSEFHYVLNSAREDWKIVRKGSAKDFSFLPPKKAYTCAELGVMLGSFQVVKNNQTEEWDLLSCGYPDSVFLPGADSLLYDEYGDGGDDITESQVRGAALIWLIKSGHIKAEEVKL